MSTATAMSKPPPPSRKRPPPPPPRRMGAGPRRGPPPPPPSSSKRSADDLSNPKNKAARSQNRRAPPPGANRSFRMGGKFGKEITIRKPVELRHVNDYEKKQQVGKGTYGDVFMGADKKTGTIVALKRINTAREEHGFPITSIREVKILKALNHANIVKLFEIVTSEEREKKEKTVYLVFEYHEFDLSGILETKEIRLNQDHIKSWSRQLLAGVHYMHVNSIMHRDLKSSNILISKSGELKICDWGLARSYTKEMRQLTTGVVTLWYKPIELLLGCKRYSTKIDMWSVGCIIAEMFRRRGLLMGCDEASQLDIIYKTCGHPNVEDWPQIQDMCPQWRNFVPGEGEPRLPCKLREILQLPPLQNKSWLTDNAYSLIKNLLTFNPDKRWSAKQAFAADYFIEAPTVKDASKLFMRFGVTAVHEWEARRKHERLRMASAANGTHPSHNR